MQGAEPLFCDKRPSGQDRTPVGWEIVAKATRRRRRIRPSRILFHKGGIGLEKSIYSFYIIKNTQDIGWTAVFAFQRSIAVLRMGKSVLATTKKCGKTLEKTF